MRATDTATALLVLLAICSIQAWTGEDIYWEGEEDSANEYLEVKETDSFLGGQLKRLKRQGLFDWFLSSTEKPKSEEVVTEDPAGIDDESPGENDFESGSGLRETEKLEPIERTVRVTFVVIQPYQKEYSDRDSDQFRTFSKTLSDEVNKLYYNLPGTQKASLVRIQSRISDNFSCKVTLDIVTTGYDDTNRIVDMLRDHIRSRRSLGNIGVSDSDFSDKVIDPGETISIETCATDELQCDDGQCVSGNAQCNGFQDCNDGSDEANCSFEQSRGSRGDQSIDEQTETEPPQPEWPEQNTMPTISNEDYTTILPPYEQETENMTCPSNEMKCDMTRCVSLSKRCDGVKDCYDGTDELGCQKYCSIEDFRCDNGRCIESYRRCNRIVDCPNEEDEKNCECTANEFRCESDGSCIELRKRCDNVNNCPDNSDEANCVSRRFEWSGRHVCKDVGHFLCGDGSCISVLLRCDGFKDCHADGTDEIGCPCSPDEWQCDHGSCIKRSKRCDGRVDCPADKSDERNCLVVGFFRCDSGVDISEHLRCNRQYDCPLGDYSDEKFCPCGEDDFKCDNGFCIPNKKHCDRTHDCQDGSDERNCCYDKANSTNSTIDVQQCLPHQFTCPPSSSVACGILCDGLPDCDKGEDEFDCEDCSQKCDDGQRCLKDEQVCDGEADCSDGTDEQGCDVTCDGPDDFRCNNGECVRKDNQCNGVPDCSDYSDEVNCRRTVTPKYRCDENEYQCKNGDCINSDFQCDGNSDCRDNSDEENCPWHIARPPAPPPHPCRLSEFTCYDGRCIPHARRCDNIYDCFDFSDEQNCYNSAVCDQYSFKCGSGECIPYSKYCDNEFDCLDESDERQCPTTGRPWPTTTGYEYPPPEYTTQPPYFTTRNPYIPQAGGRLNLKTYPDQQTVRNGGDVVFQCRDEGPIRANVTWSRADRRPLKPGYIDRNGRLEMNKVTTADSGTYICQAVGYSGDPDSQVIVELVVQPPVNVPRSPFPTCDTSYQSTCGNGQCIPSTSVCDGKIDCTDRSDEDSCNYGGLCEPNQFKCKNGKCILKSWRCDSENDCNDYSDEENCVSPDLNTGCLVVEFKCATSGNSSERFQCIPKSFHCDGLSDCFDGSDEIGCAPVHVTRSPTPANLQLNPGDTLSLTCEAVGVPVPLVSWRLNWGHVPEKCTSTSEDGIGTLTCPDMQPEDSGAYSCEAMNNKGTVFAVPDSIVHVVRSGVCPSGFFNSEARSQSECIRCFCFGESKNCKSADLFTFNMPTPLGEGGTALVGVKSSYNGVPEFDQPIDNQFFYESRRNGATVTKLANHAPSWNYGYTIHPYIALPESYNGNQLTSYGGHIKYTVEPHSPGYSEDDNMPTIIIKGKYETLVHHERPGNRRSIEIKVRLTPENWQKAGPNGIGPSTREDIMMALDNIEKILLRADMNGAGVTISEFAMESAQLINTNLGAANLVEECTCPPGYEGLSCQKCASGYTRDSGGPWLGNCVREERQCPPGTYGDPDSGNSCKPCPCPLTNPQNQFARTCSLAYDGRITCDCAPGYGGRNCEYCESGLVGNPMIPGDSCKPPQVNHCNPTGTLRALSPDQCECKDQVQGRYCDQCKEDSFYLSEDFRHGCALCFCSGVSQQCRSSNLRRKTTSVSFNTPHIVDQVKVYSSAPLEAGGAIKYNAPVETELRPTLQRNELTLNTYDSSRPVIYYWSLPASFAGDKVTSYGGFLRYQLSYVRGSFSWNKAPDVQLISENQLTFHYYGNFTPTSEGVLDATVQFLEKGWHRSDGKEISREHFLLALADVKTILVKATYSTSSGISSLESASIETAEENGDGPEALHVEQCVCPPGYVGTSCEDCAPGYTRSFSGLYLEHCGKCDCNGHSDSCHPETGVCFDCEHNTAGDYCEMCAPGFDKNEYGQCEPKYTLPPDNNGNCTCDPRGQAEPCDFYGNCNCKQNVEGRYCERCRPGTFGLDAGNPLGCYDCFCSGVTNVCYEGSHYKRIPLAAPMIGEKYGGYVITDLNGEDVINDHFIPAPNESELIYIFSFPPNKELYWSLPELPGNRVLSYGGTLSLKQRFESISDDVSIPGNDVVLVGDSLSVRWTNPRPIQNKETASLRVPLRENGWFILNQNIPASRRDLMTVLKNLKRILVRATLAREVIQTAIADVEMDIATENRDPNFEPAKGVEVCECPEGHVGTSCESCEAGFYQDQNGRCQRCNCNGHDCQLGSYGTVICNCRPPYSGPDCSMIGLVMELHPIIHEDGDLNSVYRKVTLICKYRAPEPLTIKFYFEGQEIYPPKYSNESRLYKDGWHGEHAWNTVWDTRRRGEIYECHALTNRGFTLGVLSTSLPESGSDQVRNDTTRPPPPVSTVTVRITNPIIDIQEAGKSVNFTCQAYSRLRLEPPPVTWAKEGGYLPQGRSVVDNRSGLLIIYNLRPEDSGKYICESNDGVSTDQTYVVLNVASSNEEVPTVKIEPVVNEYYEGDMIELHCLTTGNPTPKISWQRTNNSPLPLSSSIYESTFVINSARQEDSGEYRCIATNSVGSDDRVALVVVRPRPGQYRDRLTVNPSSVTVNEGQSTRIVCTGTANVPAGSIVWVRQDGSQLSYNIVSNNGVLFIERAEPQNQGVYVCQSPQSNADEVAVTVNVISTISPTDQPNVTLSTAILRLPTGESGSVECNPLGYPPVQIKWKKSQGDFGPGVSQRDNSLIISNAQEDDQGYYQCDGVLNGEIVTTQYVYVEVEKRVPPLVEIWPTGEQAVPLDSTFELMCRVRDGVPSPVVMWNRSGGRPLSRHAQINPGNVLRFEKIEVNDEGEYTCTATNLAGTHSASAVIKVRSQPVITLTPSNYIDAVYGDAVNVECRAEGYPVPSVSIRNDIREVVPPTPGMAALRIRAVSESHMGAYVCIASSVAGTTEEQFMITLNRGDGGDSFGTEYYPTEAYPRPRPESISTVEGNSQSIICQAPPETTVQWRRSDGRPLPSSVQPIGNYLFFSNVSQSDEGEYECTVRDNQTQEVQMALYTRLRVVAPPRITLRPPTQTVRPGQSPTVQCVVEGDEVTNITWLPVNRPLSSRVEVRGATLIFHEIEVEDAGEYLCVAKTTLTNAEAKAEVVVTENNRDVEESHENEQYAHVGAAVHLSCHITRPNVKIFWTKNGEAIPRSVRQKNDGSLFIRLAQKSDSGVYVCLIRDENGRETSNYINLHIEGVECLESQFRCYDGTSCVEEYILCDGIGDCKDNSDEDNCLLNEKPQNRTLLDDPIYGPRGEAPPLVVIDQPRRAFRVGENVEVLCRSTERGTQVSWIRLGENQQQQYVPSRTYRDGSLLTIEGVQESEAGIYRCIGTDEYRRRNTYEDFNLEVEPSSVLPRPVGEQNTVHTAKLGDSIELPCYHDLELPVQYEWKREYAPLPDTTSSLRLDRVRQANAGTYICRVWNNRGQAESRATLRVVGVVPQFDGNAWLSMPTLKDAYNRFEIEISFKPSDGNGLILYNSQQNAPYGKYLALHLVDSVPEFILNTGSDPIIVRGDRPLTLNEWHTIRVTRTQSKVTMTVDNNGPFVKETSGQWLLELYEPLYIGGLRQIENLPEQISSTPGFIGCVSMLILSGEEKDIMMDSTEKHNVKTCETCSPNLCQNDGVCQEALTERGFTCLCKERFAGLTCDREGESCRPGLCGPGKCTNTAEGYKCSCPVPYTGKNCEVKQSIEYPAFTGSTYLAITAPRTHKYFKMSMKVKPTAPVTDGVIMYCAESIYGHGGFMAATVKDGKLEFRYYPGDSAGTTPIVVTADRPLPANDWTELTISRLGLAVSMKINNIYKYEKRLPSPRPGTGNTDIRLDTPLFVGGVDDSIVLNSNVGVTGGFSGCIRDVILFDERIDIVNSSIQSANVQECSNDEYPGRGDIPEESVCSLCRNGGGCSSPTQTACTCPTGFSGVYCEVGDACASRPCLYGECRPDDGPDGYSCDCQLPYTGPTCDKRLDLINSVGFNGNGYIELQSLLLDYSKLQSEDLTFAISFYTTSPEGVLVYQTESRAPVNSGDFILLRISGGRVVFDWNFGSGQSSVSVPEIVVNDGKPHSVIVQLHSSKSVTVTVDQIYSNYGDYYGFSNIMNADSNIYIGGLSEQYQALGHKGLTGCVLQVELSGDRGIDLSTHAVGGRNAHACENSKLY